MVWLDNAMMLRISNVSYTIKASLANAMMFYAFMSWFYSADVVLPGDVRRGEQEEEEGERNVTAFFKLAKFEEGFHYQE